MFMRVHRNGAETVVALCDDGLIGKILTDGKIHIDLQRFGSFYNDRKVEKQTALEALKEATSVNAVGEEAVAAVKSAFGVNEEAIIRVAGVPHIQIYKL